MSGFLRKKAYFLVLFLFLLVSTSAEQNQGLDDCKETYCSPNGPVIRFPFRLKSSRRVHRGCPGFDLSCTQSNDTVLELPISVRLYVKKINYKSQSIQVYDANDCLALQLPNLNLSASPFRYKLHHNDYIFLGLVNYSFFNCSSTNRYVGKPIPCLSSPGYQVYALRSYYPIDYIPSSLTCTKIKDISSLPGYILSKNTIHLNWSQPACTEETECSNNHKPYTGTTKLTITGISLGLFLLIVVTIALYRSCSLDMLERENQAKIEMFLDDYKALKPARYTYNDIKRITNQFEDKLGQGGYGTVYKGRLSSDVSVAVKVLNTSKGNGEEFINEVGIIGRIHHVNVVRLVGYCADGFRRALIYEFLPSSLEKLISKEGKYNFLDWKKKQDIAIGIAKGIEYLHQGCEQRILHFDIKPHNILLDHNTNPKIADFGQAKLCSKDQSVVSMTTARGTMGYIAPEVFSRSFGNVSHKSDVYSFGMLLLQIVGERETSNANMETKDQIYFPEWIYHNLKNMEETGNGIEDVEFGEIAKKLIIVGLWCIQWHPVDRPSMKVVVQMLEAGDTLTMPPNPFGATKVGASMQARPSNGKLDVISELE